jgi:hypothetical protein
MKPQPDPKGPRPVPPIHPDTITFEKHLRAFKVGQKVSYEELATLVRRDYRANEAAIKAHVRSAENRLRNLEGMVFSWFHDEKTDVRGRVRLDDEQIVDLALHRTGSLSRSAKRIVRLAACADPVALSADKQQQQAVVMLAARGAERFASSKGRERVLRLVSNSTERIPELDQAWKALQNGI